MRTSPLRPPLLDSLVDTSGIATRTFQNWLNSVSTQLNAGGPFLLLSQFGNAGNGADDTAVFQAAVAQAVANGGGIVFIPAGSFSVGMVTIPQGTAAITFMGAGAATVINRRGDIAAGHGLFDVYSSNVTFSDLVIDGGVTVPTPLLYNSGFSTGISANDPMAASLTTNTSIWVHGPATNFYCNRLTVTHSGGYSILLDASTGGISDVTIINSEFSNSRPSIFGVTAGQELYGSWNGGVFYNGSGSASSLGCVVKRMKVLGCTFLRNTGNALWGHLTALDELHESLQFTDNTFLDCGLDGVLMGGVRGGCVSGNAFRRVGYVCTDDTSQSVPRWLPNLNATALDSSGMVINVSYCDNSFESINGGCLDGDSYCLGSITGNVCRTPLPGELGYDEDQISISGPTNSGSQSYGFNLSNNANQPLSATNITVTGNAFLNLTAGAIRLFAGRRCLVEANTIVAPVNSSYAPILLGPIGPGPNQRCHSNRISHNKFDYAPAIAKPCVEESEMFAPFTAAEENAVFGNCPVTPSGTLATEFQPSAHSGSVHYTEQIWWT